MTEYFKHVLGGFSLYVDSEDVTLSRVRFCFMRHGEDPDVVLKTFWEEHHNGDFLVSILTAYGEAPRIGLCTKQSLTDALRTAVIDPGSRTEQLWKGACAIHRVEWPKRLQQSSTETEPKAAA